RRKWLAKLLAFTVLAGNASAETIVATSGPFEILTESQRISSGRFPNISGSFFEKMPVASYRVNHKGIHQNVSGIDENSGKMVTYEEFWDALILDDAPHPSLIVGCIGVYLMTERDGRVSVDTLAPITTDIATLQWIDEPGGLGQVYAITIRDSSKESHHFRGGRYLLVNNRVVLDVATLNRIVLPSGAQTISGPPAIFHANWIPRWLSPGRTQYAFISTRNRMANNQVVDSDYAVVVVNFAAGSAYAVPFDRNQLHYYIAEYEPLSEKDTWFSRHFRWTRDSGGIERLELRAGVKPLPWTGRIARDGNNSGMATGYKVDLATASMLPILEAFIVREFAGRRLSIEEVAGSTRVKLLVGSSTLVLSHSNEFRNLALHMDPLVKQPSEQAFRVIESIGQRFNAELEKGMHQEHFMRMEGLW
ncbi:MAG: hypothetical protein V2B20_00935, partial [Pseudomonadota bacterium]